MASSLPLVCLSDWKADASCWLLAVAAELEWVKFLPNREVGTGSPCPLVLAGAGASLNGALQV